MKRGMFGKFVDTMLMSACSLAFFAFLRCGEFTIQNGNLYNMLSVKDIMIDDSMNAFILVLKSSKTDPFRQGISLRIFKSGKRCAPSTQWWNISRSAKPGTTAEYLPYFLSKKMEPR